MHHLIIAAHPRAKSFNHAVVRAYTTALAERGHQVACRDLYAIGFNPILSARDMAAIGRSKLPIDIRRELHAIAAADAITVIAPLWWGGFPAKLKGYVDRVFTAGSPYLAKNKAYGRSLSGRKGAIITTSEASVDELRSDGTLRALKRHHKGLMEYCGVEVVGAALPWRSRSHDEPDCCRRSPQEGPALRAPCILASYWLNGASCRLCLITQHLSVCACRWMANENSRPSRASAWLPSN